MMEKVSAAFLMLFVLGLIGIAIAIPIPIPRAHCLDKGPKAVEAWFEKHPEAKEKVTKLHFYFPDIVSGKTPSAITVAQANITPPSPTNFGLVRMMEDALTVGPEPDLKIIGWDKGIYGGASFEEMGLLMTLNFVFTEGKYNGSTLSVLGHNPILDTMPIVGGTGVFRLARGITLISHSAWNASLLSRRAVYESPKSRRSGT